MGRTDHQLAQQLDLARRKSGLSSRDLAEALHCDPRTVRRYISGDRRPSRQMVELWEQRCELEPGTLTRLIDRPTDAAPPQDDSTPSRRVPRAWLACAAVALALVGLGLFLRLRPSSTPQTAAVVHSSPASGDIQHHFTPSYKGQVWFRIAPTRVHRGEDHVVRIRWGNKQNTFTVDRLGSQPRTFVLQKMGVDDTTFLVRIAPPASVDFGEGAADDGHVEEVPSSSWTKRTSG